MAIFSRRYVYSASLHQQISVRAIDPVHPQAIFPMRVTLFLSGMLCVTNIPSVNCNDTSFSSELNGENAGESSKSLRFIIFEISSSIFKKAEVDEVEVEVDFARI